jgi:hypothetical protein
MIRFGLFLLIVAVFVGCKSGEDAFGNKWDSINYGDSLELYYGTTTVGKALIDQRVVDYGMGDNAIGYTLIEELTYRGNRYRFEFTGVGEITSIKVLRYQRRSDSLFYPNDSYEIINNQGGVVHRFFDTDGKTVVRERQIKSPRFIANTNELFQYCNSYISSYFMMLEDKKARYLRHNRIQSLGYELLKFERI